MPWIKNEVDFQQDVRSIYSTANRHLMYYAYRSRNPIDQGLASIIPMMFLLPNVSAIEQAKHTRVNIRALAKGLDDAALISDVKQILHGERDSFNTFRIVSIYNMNSNQTAATTAVNALLADGWTQHDFRAALSCDPFHSTIVLHKPNDAGGHTVIFSTITNDAFILKLAAVLPILYGFALPADLTKALLEGDKQLFNATYYKEIGEIIKQRVKVKILTDLDRLGAELQKVDTSAITERKNAVERNINDYLNALREKYTMLNELNMQLSSTFWNDLSKNVVDFINYIKQYNLDMITKLQFDGNYFRVGMALITPLLYWDERLYKNYLNSSSSNFVKETGKSGVALLNNILLDKTVEVIFHTGVLFSFKDNVFQQNAHLLNSDEYVGIPHSHLHYHNCLGDNASLITRAFTDKNYLVLWEQVKSTLSGINVTDSIVFKKFVRDITVGFTNVPSLRLKDTGELITNIEFYKRYPDGYVPAPVVEVVPEPVKPERKTRRTAPIEREEE